MTCGTCRYHTYEDVDKGYVCTNVDSDMLAEWTKDDYSCNHWEGEIEQDGDVTWEIG